MWTKRKKVSQRKKMRTISLQFSKQKQCFN